MALNYIQVFDDTVVKMSINLGLESQRQTVTLGSFTIGELAFTRDSGRVFVGDFTDENHPGQLETVGGILVGNKYLGSIDSRPLEIFDRSAEALKPLSYTSEVKPVPESGFDYIERQSESGVIYTSSKFKIHSDNFDAGLTLTETNWSRWNRKATYNEKYDAFDGDYVYDKFQNALILFDSSIKPVNDNEKDKFVISGWVHKNYGPSFKVWIDNLCFNKGVLDYDSVVKFYPFAKKDEGDGKYYAVDKDGARLKNGNDDIVLSETTFYSFFIRKNNKSSRVDFEKVNWDGLWLIENEVFKKLHGESEDTSNTIIAPVYLDKDGLPFDVLCESLNRTLMYNRVGENFPVYGDGYVVLRNVEPDGETIKFKARKPYDPQIGNNAEGESSNMFSNNTAFSSNILEIGTIKAENTEGLLDEKDFIIPEDSGSYQLDDNLYINSISSTDALKLPSTLTLSDTLLVSNRDERGSEKTSGVTLDFSSLINTEVSGSGIYFVTFEKMLKSGYKTLLTDVKTPFYIKLGEGLIGDKGSKTITGRFGEETEESIKLDSVSSSLISDAFKMQYRGSQVEHEYPGVQYSGSLVISPTGQVIDSDKFYNGDCSNIKDNYRELNTPINFIQTQKPLIWTISPNSSEHGFLAKLLFGDQKMICSELKSDVTSNQKFKGLGCETNNTTDSYISAVLRNGTIVDGSKIYAKVSPLMTLEAITKFDEALLKNVYERLELKDTSTGATIGTCPRLNFHFINNDFYNVRLIRLLTTKTLEGKGIVFQNHLSNEAGGSKDSIFDKFKEFYNYVNNNGEVKNLNSTTIYDAELLALNFSIDETGTTTSKLYGIDYVYAIEVEYYNLNNEENITYLLDDEGRPTSTIAIITEKVQFASVAENNLGDTKPDNLAFYYEKTPINNSIYDFNVFVNKDGSYDYANITECTDVKYKRITGVANRPSSSPVIDFDKTIQTIDGVQCILLNVASSTSSNVRNNIMLIDGNYNGNSIVSNIVYVSNTYETVPSGSIISGGKYVDVPDHARSILLNVDVITKKPTITITGAPDSPVAEMSTVTPVILSSSNEAFSKNYAINSAATKHYTFTDDVPSNNIMSNGETMVFETSTTSSSVIEVPIHVSSSGEKYTYLRGYNIDNSNVLEFVINYVGYRV